MKAWQLGIDSDPDQGVQIVFADTRNQARAQADSCDMFYDSWIDIRAVRFKGLDDKENLDKAHRDLILWREYGWNWIDYNAPDQDEATDEEFLKWHYETF